MEEKELKLNKKESKTELGSLISCIALVFGVIVFTIYVFYASYKDIQTEKKFRNDIEGTYEITSIEFDEVNNEVTFYSDELEGFINLERNPSTAPRLAARLNVEGYKNASLGEYSIVSVDNEEDMRIVLQDYDTADNDTIYITKDIYDKLGDSVSKKIKLF